MMLRGSIIAALALTLAVAPPSPLRAAPPVADAEYVRDVVGRAAAQVDAGRHAQALEVLDRAERERPLPVFVYVRATIEEHRGDCDRAVALYSSFLELEIPPKDAEDARRGIRRCRGEPDPQDPALAPPEPASEPVAAPPLTAPEEPPPRRWHTDPLGGVLLVAGVAGLGVGVGLYGQSRADQRAAQSATTLQSFDDRSRRAITLDRASIVTIALGSALMLGGALRYALVGTRPRRRTALHPTTLRIYF